MHYEPTRALELLRLGVQQESAVFRDGQEEAIRHVVEGRGRLLVVQKTGWGKSSVYFIATRMLRDQGSGPALLISPLLALMRNQIAAAERMGVRAATIHSENREDWDPVGAAIARDEVDVLLISPERLANERFRDEVLGTIAGRISLLVIDEAHCISDWGHDFRPHYRLIERMIRALPSHLRLLGTTATANNRVLDDLVSVLGPELTVSRGELSRPSLSLQTIRLPGQAERMAWLAEHVPALPGHGIIYTLTVRDAERVAAWLRWRRRRGRGLFGGVGRASGGTGGGPAGQSRQGPRGDHGARHGLRQAGPRLRHPLPDARLGRSPIISRSAGRAGRCRPPAGVLLSGAEETEITDYFIDSAFPTRDEVGQVLDAMKAAPGGLSIPSLLGRVNISFTRVEKTVQLLSLESPSPVVRRGSKWSLTAAPLGEAFWQRAERLTTLRRAEQRQMQDYVNLASGHMEFLIRAFDGRPDAVQPPGLPPLATTPDASIVQDAVSFLRRTNLTLEPRKMWPAGGLPTMAVSGRIAEPGQARPGKVLCVWGDSGWGAMVRDGKRRRWRLFR